LGHELVCQRDAVRNSIIKQVVCEATHQFYPRQRKTDGTAYFTTDQVASRWGFHPESIRRLIRQRSIAAVVLGRRLLIPVSEIDRIEREGRISRGN